MKKLFLIFIIVFMAIPAFGYEIAFPLEKDITLSQDGIFFVGKLNKKETIRINDRQIIPKKNGSFAESFKLNPGENIFKIFNEENKECDTYTITSIRTPENDDRLIEFPTKDCITICDDVILRSTPIDFGMNRIGYLPKNTSLQITGIKNEFSRVYLNNKVSGWVMTKHIIPEQRDVTVLGEYRGESIKSDNNVTTKSYKFSKNLPYSAIYKDGVLYIDVYNVENRPNQTYHSEIKLDVPYCYSVKMFDNELVVSIPKININKDVKIVLDAGHGGNENGAVGCMSDLEKDMNLKTTKVLYKELKSKHYKVYMTRLNDKFVSLKDRVDFSKNKKAVIFISLHMNSVPESSDPNSRKGTETYYYTEFSKPLADLVQSCLAKSLGTYDNGVKQASFAVIRPTEYVGILVETAFMVNPEDVEIYKSKSFFKRTALGISKGIEKYLDGLK